MIKLIGFQAQSGSFTSETTGEVINWSNRLLRCVSDENIEKGEFGLKVVEQKLKTVHVCNSLGISITSTEDEVNTALKRVLNSDIVMTMGLVRGKFDINGFKVVKS